MAPALVLGLPTGSERSLGDTAGVGSGEDHAIALIVGRKLLELGRLTQAKLHHLLRNRRRDVVNVVVARAAEIIPVRSRRQAALQRSCVDEGVQVGRVGDVDVIPAVEACNLVGLPSAAVICKAPDSPPTYPFP